MEDSDVSKVHEWEINATFIMDNEDRKHAEEETRGFDDFVDGVLQELDVVPSSRCVSNSEYSDQFKLAQHAFSEAVSDYGLVGFVEDIMTIIFEQYLSKLHWEFEARDILWSPRLDEDIPQSLTTIYDWARRDFATEPISGLDRYSDTIPFGRIGSPLQCVLRSQPDKVQLRVLVGIDVFIEFPDGTAGLDLARLYCMLQSDCQLPRSFDDWRPAGFGWNFDAKSNSFEGFRTCWRSVPKQSPHLLQYYELCRKLAMFGHEDRIEVRAHLVLYPEVEDEEIDMIIAQ